MGPDTLSPFGPGSGRFFFWTDRAQIRLGPEHVSEASGVTLSSIFRFVGVRSSQSLTAKANAPLRAATANR